MHGPPTYTVYFFLKMNLIFNKIIIISIELCRDGSWNSDLAVVLSKSARYQHPLARYRDPRYDSELVQSRTVTSAKWNRSRNEILFVELMQLIYGVAIHIPKMNVELAPACHVLDTYPS